MRDVNNKRFIEFADIGYGLLPLKIFEEHSLCKTIQDAYNQELQLAKEYGVPKRFKIIEINPNSKYEIDAFSEAFNWYKNEMKDLLSSQCETNNDKVVNKLYEIIKENEKQVRELENKIAELEKVVKQYKHIVGDLNE